VPLLDHAFGGDSADDRERCADRLVHVEADEALAIESPANSASVSTLRSPWATSSSSSRRCSLAIALATELDVEVALGIPA
jgi:hypothetical protein